MVKETSRNAKATRYKRNAEASRYSGAKNR
jgi:hypothetical protein